MVIKRQYVLLAEQGQIKERFSADRKVDAAMCDVRGQSLTNRDATLSRCTLVAGNDPMRRCENKPYIDHCRRQTTEREALYHLAAVAVTVF